MRMKNSMTKPYETIKRRYCLIEVYAYLLNWDSRATSTIANTLRLELNCMTKEKEE